MGFHRKGQIRRGMRICHIEASVIPCSRADVTGITSAARVETLASACPPCELPLQRHNSRSQPDVLGRGGEPSAAQVEDKHCQTDDGHRCHVATSAVCRAVDRHLVACDPALRPSRRMPAGTRWNRPRRRAPDHRGRRDWDGRSHGNARAGDARLQCRCRARIHRT